jgi:L,D-peptidoglycan transpeptidase YkuD (ErfK/YbiS/YcfS/YnhG family)
MYLSPSVLQLIIVLAPDWESSNGYLYRFKRHSAADDWHKVGSAIHAFLGKNGLAWGRGEFFLEEEPLLKKEEGDLKTPAGVFKLGSLFGLSQNQTLISPKMSFIEIDEHLVCVDDPKSKYYNRLIYRNQVDDIDWQSSEEMFLMKDLYDLGLVIEHNIDPTVPNCGSAIFMHKASIHDPYTKGCIALKDHDLVKVLSWIEDKAHPRIVQLPKNEYKKRIEDWGLPEIDDFKLTIS